jgi:hypothetical protein
MDFEAAVARERRRDFARRFVVHRAISAAVRRPVDLTNVTTETHIAELGLQSEFIVGLAEDFGWSKHIPTLDTLGDLVDFFASHYTAESRIGERMHLFGCSAVDPKNP